MILGTWNLEGAPSPSSPKGFAQIAELLSHSADVWFLTEIHETLRVPCMQLVCSPMENSVLTRRRWAAIATHWHLEPVPASDHPIASFLCLAHLTDPETDEAVLAVASVSPWRGAAGHWRKLLGLQSGFADICDVVNSYFVACIEQEIRPDERLVWGGDFNQGLGERDYVGTLQGRAALTREFDSCGLQVPTRNLAAHNPDQPAIDHIAIPAKWSVLSDTKVFRPERHGRPLSDHALYVVHTRHEGDRIAGLS